MSNKHPPVPVSSVQGIEWPAIPTHNGRIILSLLHQLEQTERWSADEIHAGQFRQLGRVLSHASNTVPYYRERLKEWGIKNPPKLTELSGMDFICRPPLGLLKLVQ